MAKMSNNFIKLRNIRISLQMFFSYLGGPENAECERKCASDCECVNECIEKGCPEPPTEADGE